MELPLTHRIRAHQLGTLCRLMLGDLLDRVAGRLRSDVVGEGEADGKRLDGFGVGENGVGDSNPTNIYEEGLVSVGGATVTQRRERNTDLAWLIEISCSETGLQHRQKAAQHQPSAFSLPLDKSERSHPASFLSSLRTSLGSLPSKTTCLTMVSSLFLLSSSTTPSIASSPCP
jgi:hypothetical protein